MSLHNEIMNIKCDPEQPAHDKSYREGHRDARHAAAELSLKADTEITRLKQALTQIEASLLHGYSDKELLAIIDDAMKLHISHEH